MERALDYFERDTSVELAVLFCAGPGFVAGADLKEMNSGQHNRSDDAARMINRLASSRKPVLAAVHGYALGGGFELALACDYRCALESARFGLPEINLGAIPGFGGTQRLPRIMGMERSLDLMLTGQPIVALEAERAGVVDRVVRADLIDAATVYARELIEGGALLRKADRREVPDKTAAAQLCERARHRAAVDRPGEDAPELLIRAAMAAVASPPGEGLEYERSLARQRRRAPQCLAMRHLFFADRAARKNPVLGAYYARGGESVAEFRARIRSCSWGEDLEYKSGKRILSALDEAVCGLRAEGVGTTRTVAAMNEFGWALEPFMLPLTLAGEEILEPFPDDKAMDSAIIVERCLSAVAEAGSKLLQDDEGTRASDIDSMCCSAYGFPRYRGGPMYCVSRGGLSKVISE